MAKKYTKYELEDGTVVPGVTTILSKIDKGQGLRNWLMTNGKKAVDIMNQAGEFGDSVHTMIETYVSGKKVNPGKSLNNILDSFKEWEASNVKEWLCSEQKVLSEKYKYGGTTDGAFIDKDGKRVLFDMKTSNSIHDEYVYQLAAYRQALREMGEGYDRAMILHWNKEIGCWVEKEVDTEEERHGIKPIDVFLSALTIYTYQKG